MNIVRAIACLTPFPAEFITITYYFLSLQVQACFLKRNRHETDLEMSPGPLGTTVFEEIHIRTMGK